MGKHNGIAVHGILFGHQKESNTDTRYNMGESLNVTLKERRQTQKVTYYMILFTQNVQNSKSTEIERQAVPQDWGG